MTWDSTSYVAGLGGVAAHGRVPGGRKKVLLQVKLPGRWKTIGKTKSSRKGKFAISAPLAWYGTHKVRVATSGKRAFKRGTKVSVATAYAPRGNPASHTFMTTDTGQRYTFNPCQTVRYAINAEDVGQEGVDLVHQSVAQLSAATGIKLKYVGSSNRIPNPNKIDNVGKRVDLLIAWATAAEEPSIAPPVAGRGGQEKAVWGRTARGKKVALTRTASIVLSTDAFLSTLDKGFVGARATWGEVVLHELGHAFGLYHVDSADELMHPNGGAWYPDGLRYGRYNAGDLAGLAKSGLGQGCIKPIRHARTGRVMPVPVPAPVP